MKRVNILGIILFSLLCVFSLNAEEYTDGIKQATGWSITSGLVSAVDDIRVLDDNWLRFGTSNDFYVGYDETTDNALEITDGTNSFVKITDGGTTAAYDWQASTHVTTGKITGAIGVITDTDGIDLSAAQSYGYAVIMTGAGDVELADVCDTATGANVLVFVRDAAETVSIAVNDAADTIVYPGLSLGADDELDSPGSAGDFVCVACLAANTWYVIGARGAWSDGGAAD